MKTRSDAWALLTEFTQSQPLRRHALAVETKTLGIQPNLDPVFLAALRQWRYAPAVKAGEGVAVFLVITVMF